MVSMVEVMIGGLKGAWELNWPLGGSLWESLPRRGHRHPLEQEQGWQITWRGGREFPCPVLAMI